MGEEEEEEGRSEGVVVSTGLWYLGRGIDGEEETWSPEAEEAGSCRRKAGSQPGFLRRQGRAESSAVLRCAAGWPTSLLGMSSRHSSCSVTNLDDLLGGLLLNLLGRY